MEIGRIQAVTFSGNLPNFKVHFEEKLPQLSAIIRKATSLLDSSGNRSSKASR